ncbi:MAG: hypothetical protein PHP20_00085 [Firmicutes bacterium]|jgi:hypothetical protein|nr:hypothetical protein [Bacillota bacterium]MDD4791456.1 hypothetical protein [Bacillota bacterium]
MGKPENSEKKTGSAALGCGFVLIPAIALLFAPKGCRKEGQSALMS